MSSRNVGEFTGVARILFDSAAKSGIVDAQSKRQFAKQLQKLAGQAKKKGGSLGGVTLKLSEFVEREVPPIQPLRREGVSTAKRVPLLDFGIRKSSQPSPLPQPGAAQKSPSSAMQSEEHPSAMLQLHIPLALRKKSQQPGGQLKAESASVSPAVAAPAQPPARPVRQSLSSLWSDIPQDDAQLFPGGGASPTPAPHEFSGAVATQQPEVKRPRIRVSIDEASSVIQPFSDDKTAAAAAAAYLSAAAPSVLPQHATSPPSAAVKAAEDKSAAPRRQRARVVPVSEQPTMTSPIAREAETTAPPAATFVSIDDWEVQRENELRQLQRAQEEHDARVAAAALLEEHKRLGEEWAVSRLQTSPRNSVAADPLLTLNEKIYFAPDWVAAIEAFDACVQSSAAAESQQFPEYTVNLVLQKALRQGAPVTRVKQLVSSIETHSIIKSQRNAPALQSVLNLFAARYLSPTVGGEAASSATSSAAAPRQSLGKELAVKLRRAARDNLWEDAVDTYTKAVNELMATTSNAPDTPQYKGETNKTLGRYGRLLSTALQQCRGMQKEIRRELASQLAAALRKTHPARVLDRPSSVSLARLARGAPARGYLPQVSDKGADEEILALHIEFAKDEEEVLRILQDAAHAQLNTGDPQVVSALSIRAAYSSTPSRAFAILKEHQAAGRPLTKHCAQAAVRAARLVDDRESVEAAMEVVRSCSGLRGKTFLLRALAPILYDERMYTEILELYDMVKDRVDVATSLPTIALYVNSALKDKGLPPLCAGDASSLPPRVRGSTVASERSNSTAATSDATAQSSSASLESVVSTDVLIQYARERDWVSAMAALEQLPATVSPSQQPTVTLLYNCALSAASEHPEHVESLLQRMKDRGVEFNVTTHNTAMSCFAKSESMWERAVSIYEGMKPNQRDASTYSVLLSVLAKSGQWERSVDAFVEMKGLPHMPKPTPVLYGLGILATHKHSWSHTLQLFHDMLKHHGAASIKEVVVLRVLRSLEDNKRFAEIQRVEREMEKGKKKGGKKK